MGPEAVLRNKRRELMPRSYEAWQWFSDAFGKLPEFHAEEAGQRIDYKAKEVTRGD